MSLKSITNHDVVKHLWRSLGLPSEIPERYLHLTGDSSRTLQSSFNLGLAAQASIAAAGLAATHFHALCTREAQTVTVNARHAAIEFHSEAYYAINASIPGGIWDDLAGTYPTKDNSFVRLHTNFPHHRKGVLSILDLDFTASREAVAQALSTWDSKQFEDEAARKGMCVTAMRSVDEWDMHPHAKAIKDAPPVQLIKISDAPKKQILNIRNKGAMEGVRVLDLTRVIAGPVCGRTLAAYGADVLLITSPNLPSLPNLDAETSRGKRTTQLNLNSTADRDTLECLVRESDVFLQSYRPGGLAEKGFGVSDLAKIRPGIVCANLTAWGWEGPWKNRRGFDSLVQTATGFNVSEAQDFASFQGESNRAIVPKPFPVQALDHAAGYLLAFGITAGLCKTMTEGGSWEVSVSLASVGNWIRSLGRLGPDGFRNSMALPKRVYPPDDEISQLSTVLKIPNSPISTRTHVSASVGSGCGGHTDGGSTMLALKHSAILEKTPCAVTEAPVKLDVDPPCWLPRN